MKSDVESLITLYVNGVAIVLVIGLLYQFYSFKVKKDAVANRLFLWLGITVIISAAASMDFYAYQGLVIEKPLMIRMILPTLFEIVSAVVVLLWVMYADYKIYGSKERLQHLRLAYLIPMLCVIVMFVINFFTEILFDVDTNMMLHFKPLYYVVEAAEYIFCLIPAAVQLRYTKRYGKLHFFSVLPMTVPVVLAAVFTLLTYSYIAPIGFAVGMVFLLLSYGVQWRYDDMESGLYNHWYIRQLLYMARDGKRNYQSAMFFTTDEATKAYFDILRTELPKEGELVRIDSGTVLLFTECSRQSMLSFMSSMVSEAMEEYSEQHPEEKRLEVRINTKRRKKNETATDFVKRITEG